MDLKSIQERFEAATEKEHWEQLKTLLFFGGQRERRYGNELIENTRTGSLL